MSVVSGAYPEVARPTYAEGQYLSAADFVAEQAYHRQTLARHETGQHTWGIVVGFELAEVLDPADAGLVDVFLTPGLATDGYGRQLVSFGAIPVDPALFAAFTDAAHRSVWLAYTELYAAATADGYADCADAQPTRAIETFRLVIDPVDPITDVVVDGQIVKPPPAVDAAIPADTSVPFQDLPEEPPLARWLIPIGWLFWDGAARRFRPAGARRTDDRRYAGAVAADVLAPAETLRVARRTAPADVDAADFATVEGRLRAQGRINAERELWMEGDPIRFTGDGGAEPVGRQLTLGRDTGPVGGKDRLRLTLGASPSPDVSLSIGTAADVHQPDPVAEVRADGRVRVPQGPLDFGTVHRQEVEFKAAAYGLGTQEGVQYQRSPSMFAWYTGGAHSATPLDPGTGASGPGVRRLVLDAEGSLDFGGVTHQMLKLWSYPGATTYGIGVQYSTLYFRTDSDFCWFRDGSHADLRSSPGAGGTLAMKLDDNSLLQVFGAERVTGDLTVGAGGNAKVLARHVNGKSGVSDAADNLYLNWATGLDVYVGGGGPVSNLDVSGGVRVRGTGQGAVESVIKVIKTDLEVVNGFSGGRGLPGNWSWSWAGQLDEVYTVYCVVNGFAMVIGQLFSTDPGRLQSAESIPQNLWARVDGFDATHAWGRAFLAQSDPAKENDNAVAVTVVAIGRNLP